MAKFLEVRQGGDKFVVYINLDNVSVIQSYNGGTTVYFVAGENDYCEFNIPLSEFMDLVNSEK